jgi:hypothetical protein
LVEHAGFGLFRFPFGFVEYITVRSCCSVEAGAAGVIVVLRAAKVKSIERTRGIGIIVDGLVYTGGIGSTSGWKDNQGQQRRSEGWKGRALNDFTPQSAIVMNSQSSK